MKRDPKIQKAIDEGKIIPFDVFFKEQMKDPEMRELYEKEKTRRERFVRNKLARKIKKAREEAGLSQEQLAKTLKTTRSYISEVESGRQNISVGYASKIATALRKQLHVDFY